MLMLIILASVMTGTRAENGCGSCESPNVRTVLFKQSDLVKDCWSDEELALLYSRRLVQELIPTKVSCRTQVLLEYLKIALQAARDITCSPRVHKLIIMSMADALGGYLQAYGLPITNAKYYEGTVSYCTARQVNELQSAFKRSLDTNGGGWTKEVFVKKSCKIVPYVVPSVPQSVCVNLVTSSEPRDRRLPLQGAPYSYRGPPEPVVPLPFLDDPNTPRAIAVPFRDRSLYSLFSRNSSDILLRYYSTVLSCLGPGGSPTCTSDPYSNQRIESFVVSFHAWLGRAILTRLHDDIWYPGFGGVYRILEEMAGRGLITQEVAYDDTVSEDFSLKSDDKCDTCLKSNIWYNAWVVLAIFALFWLVVLNLCCLIKFCGRRNENDYPCTPTTSSSGVVINSLVSMYCEKKKGNNEKLERIKSLSGSSKLSGH